jgi:hypothetical protein
LEAVFAGGFMQAGNALHFNLNESTERSRIMRKMIMLAIAGFVWKKVQGRILGKGQAQRNMKVYRG